jgi:hypothetical protein
MKEIHSKNQLNPYYGYNTMRSLWLHSYGKEWADIRSMPEVRSMVVQQTWQKGKLLSGMSPQVFGWKIETMSSQSPSTSTRMDRESSIQPIQILRRAPALFLQIDWLHSHVWNSDNVLCHSRTERNDCRSLRMVGALRD